MNILEEIAQKRKLDIAGRKEKISLEEIKQSAFQIAEEELAQTGKFLFPLDGRGTSDVSHVTAGNHLYRAVHSYISCACRDSSQNHLTGVMHKARCAYHVSPYQGRLCLILSATFCAWAA